MGSLAQVFPGWVLPPALNFPRSAEGPSTFTHPANCWDEAGDPPPGAPQSCPPDTGGACNDCHPPALCSEPPAVLGSCGWMGPLQVFPSRVGVPGESPASVEDPSSHSTHLKGSGSPDGISQKKGLCTRNSKVCLMTFCVHPITARHKQFPIREECGQLSRTCFQFSDRH